MNDSGSIFSMREYFPNREGECFSTALANALISLPKPDEEIAREVFNNLRGHELVIDNTLHIGVVTRVLFDATHHRYNGTLHATFPRDIEQITRAYYGKPAEDVISAMRQEIKEGRIKDQLGDMTYGLPSLLLVNASKNEEDLGHWIVDIGNDNYVNGRRIFQTNRHVVTMGVLELARNKEI